MTRRVLSASNYTSQTTKLSKGRGAGKSVHAGALRTYGRGLLVELASGAGGAIWSLKPVLGE
jgi:hypothetical protein